MYLKMHIQTYLFLIGMIGLLTGCASTGTPNGGPRDTRPPELVEEKSSKNFSTNFIPEKIELVFDEWIELKNQQREILISPPFFKNPKISSRGKKVTVEFPEEEPLRPDATYTINFGKSIVDFTESNPKEGFRFVFATGDKIDSLTFSGEVVDSRDGTPVKDILVLFYDLLGDSVVVSEKPFYYARTDESGKFQFENLKQDTFKLLVLEDLNFNYLYDEEVERVAFPDSLYILDDSTQVNPTLRLFKAEDRLRILDSSSETPGLVSTNFNNKAENVEYSYLYPDNFNPLIEYAEDSLLLWYTEPLDSVGLIFGLDTLDFTLKPFDSLFYAKKIALGGSNVAKEKLAPFDSLIISFRSPLESIDTSMIKLMDAPKPEPPAGREDKGTTQDSLLQDSIYTDSLNLVSDTLLVDTMEVEEVPIDSTSTVVDSALTEMVQDSLTKDTLGVNGVVIDSTFNTVDSTLTEMVGDSLSLDSLNNEIDTIPRNYDFRDSISLRKLFISSAWKEKHSYRLELLPGALTDIYGRTNDTMIVDFSTSGRDEFGTITLNLSGLDSAQQYVILLKLNDEIIRKNVVLDIDSTSNKIKHDRLKVNTYSIELIKDDNGDGKWTTGDYWQQRQPENIKTFELEKLRENWDLEANIFWNDINAGGDATEGIESDTTRVNRPPPGVGSGNPRQQNDKETPKIEPDPKGKND